ncbi:hypothetical protein Tco_1141310, partial [Tanacetum coccineum]
PVLVHRQVRKIVWLDLDSEERGSLFMQSRVDGDSESTAVTTEYALEAFKKAAELKQQVDMASELEGSLLEQCKKMVECVACLLGRWNGSRGTGMIGKGL